jgi:hypothetical protein
MEGRREGGKKCQKKKEIRVFGKDFGGVVR